MAQRRFLSDLLGRMASAGKLRRANEGEAAQSTISLLERVLRDQGEASGLVTAMQALDRYEAKDDMARAALFSEMATRFGVDYTRLEAAIKAYEPGNADTVRRLHYASEPGSLELIRRLNRVPGATARLVNMRADLLAETRTKPELKGLDADFRHLFSSWFNRGFLEIRRVDWNTPAAVLEKIIAYEAVHEITGWDDLRQRVADPDRRLFAFFHPAMPTDPLIFVAVALTADIPGAIGPIIARERQRVDPVQARTAVFYSISNCQKGLRGISFGNFLIKQVVTELQAELPGLTTFVTLSPVPTLRGWAETREADQLTDEDRSAIAAKDGPRPEDARRITARYLTRARRSKGTALDPVAHFHLSNGAELHKVHAEADLSANGSKNSWSVMVNYLYDSDRIEANHQAYATEHTIAASAEVMKLAD